MKKSVIWFKGKQFIKEIIIGKGKKLKNIYFKFEID